MKDALLRSLERLRLLRAAFRGYETARSVALPWRASAPDGLPVPPRRLIVRVAGTPDVDWFLQSGKLAAESIRAALARQGVALAEVDAVLEFGCGCGRVTRHWRSLSRVAIAGSDHDRGAIRWCRRHLPFARFDVNALAPPLAHADERFDVVYALSVLTHLPEPLQLAWIDELKRVLRPGGHLLLTLHGARYEDRLTEEEREVFRAGRLIVRRPELAGTNLCTAFHPEPYVRQRLAAGLEIVDHVGEGATGNPHQDLYVLRRPRASAVG